jgi:hypothetical protein
MQKYCFYVSILNVIRTVKLNYLWVVPWFLGWLLPAAIAIELWQGFFFSSEISEISPETVILGPHRKMHIPFKKIRFSLNFNFEITFKRQRILLKTYLVVWSDGKLSRSSYMWSRFRIPLFSFFFFCPVKSKNTKKTVLCRPRDSNPVPFVHCVMLRRPE